MKLRWARLIRPTSSGKVLLVLCVVLYVASMTSQSNLLILPMGIVIGAMVVNAFGCVRSVTGVRLEVPKESTTEEGRRLTTAWRVEARPGALVRLLRIESGLGVWARVAGVNPGGAIELIPELELMKRGVIDLGTLEAVSGAPFGLVEARRYVGAAGEVVVAPRVYAVEPPEAAGFDAMVGGRFRGGRRTQQGGDFAGVRPFEAGDPIRQVHWKASGKGHGLMVKLFEEELSGRLTIVTDGGYGVEAGIWDDALRAAGSLVFAALDAGHHVELMDVGEAELMLCPPFADGGEILDRLARNQALKEPATAAMWDRARGAISKRSRIAVVVSSPWSGARVMVEGCRRAGRKVGVYAPEGHGEGVGGLEADFLYGKDSIRRRA